MSDKTDNIVRFPPTFRPVSPKERRIASPNEQRIGAEAREHARAEHVRAKVSTHRKLKPDEAATIAFNLWRMMTQAELKPSEIARNLKTENRTFEKNSKRYLNDPNELRTGFSPYIDTYVDLSEGIARKVFQKHDDNGGIQSCLDRALLELVRGVAAFEPSPAPTNSRTALKQLIDLLDRGSAAAPGVIQIDRQNRLREYFGYIDENGLDLTPAGFCMAKDEHVFRSDYIHDRALYTEETTRLPRFLPRVRLATLYHQHVAKELVLTLPESGLSADDPWQLYNAGLEKLGLQQPAHISGNLYPAAPEGWNAIAERAAEGSDGIVSRGRLTSAYEAVTIWLAAVPAGTGGAIRPALLITAGDGADPWVEEAPTWSLETSTWSRDQTWSGAQVVENVDARKDVNHTWPSWLQSGTEPPSAVIAHPREPLPAVLYPGRNENTSYLSLRAEVSSLGRPFAGDGWWEHQTELRLLGLDLEDDLFARCWFVSDDEHYLQQPSPEPSRTSDRPVLIRYFKDPDGWAPGPGRSLGGAMLRNLAYTTGKENLLVKLDCSAAELRSILDEYESSGREQFVSATAHNSSPVDEE